MDSRMESKEQGLIRSSSRREDVLAWEFNLAHHASIKFKGFTAREHRYTISHTKHR